MQPTTQSNSGGNQLGRPVSQLGRTLPPGEPLYPSHHDAVLALHLCVQLEKDILFYDEKGTTKEGMRYSLLNRAAADLSDAFDRVAMDEIKLASDQYVRLVLVWSTERIEVVRSQFLSMLFQLIKNIQKRHLLRNEVAEHLADDLSQKIEEAPSVYRVIETFKEALQRLSEQPTEPMPETVWQELAEAIAAEPVLTPEGAATVLPIDGPDKRSDSGAPQRRFRRPGIGVAERAWRGGGGRVRPGVRCATASAP